MNPTMSRMFRSLFYFIFFWGGGGGGGDGQEYYGGLKGTWDFWTKAELKGDREGGIWAHKGERKGTLLPHTLIPFRFQCLPCRLKQNRPLEKVHQGSQASANQHLLPADTLSWSQPHIARVQPPPPQTTDTSLEQTHFLVSLDGLNF